MNQVVVIPYPGRGHINPLMNLCRLFCSRLIQSNCTTVCTVVVTEEWLGLIGSDPKPDNLRFATIPNVIPSELHRGSDMLGFLEAVQTDMEGPVEQLLDQMELPVALIIADTCMRWPFDVANRRNISAVVYWPMSASMFSLRYHIDLLELHNHLYLDLSERGKECIDYVPGLSPFKVEDLPSILSSEHGRKFHDYAPNPFYGCKKAQSVLLTTVYELESEVIDVLRAKLPMPIYVLGPNRRPFEIQTNPSSDDSNYLKWLDSKPPRTVLYVSLGSYLSVSSSQMDEIAIGLKQSSVNFLWAARGETSRLKEVCRGDGQGLVVEWCDQLRVLLHSSVGGFLSHCGWNSVKESLFSGVPVLTFPIMVDQNFNSKVIVEDWNIGWKVRKEASNKHVVKSKEIAEIVRRFMVSESVVRKEMMVRVKKLHGFCVESVSEGGSANKALDAFIKDNFIV